MLRRFLQVLERRVLVPATALNIRYHIISPTITRKRKKAFPHTHTHTHYIPIHDAMTHRTGTCRSASRGLQLDGNTRWPFRAAQPRETLCHLPRDVLFPTRASSSLQFRVWEKLAKILMGEVAVEAKCSAMVCAAMRQVESSP